MSKVGYSLAMADVVELNSIAFKVTFSDQLREANGQINDLLNQINDLTAIKNSLTAERDILAASQQDVKDDLTDCESKFAKTTFALSLLSAKLKQKLTKKGKQRLVTIFKTGSG